MIKILDVELKTRKDKYGNPLVSDEAFIVGQKGAKAYPYKYALWLVCH